MLVASLVCLILLFLVVFIVGVTQGIDVATIFLMVIIGIPLVTVIRLLFGI